MPPICAIKIAMSASVTVAIADDRIGMFRLISLVSCVDRLASDGRMSDGPGTSNSSSKVRPVLISMGRHFLLRGGTCPGSRGAARANHLVGAHLTMRAAARQRAGQEGRG